MGIESISHEGQLSTNMQVDDETSIVAPIGRASFIFRFL